MRKFLIVLLLASAAAPASALAQRADRDGRRGERAEESDDGRRAERPERRERPERAERVERTDRAQRPQRPAGEQVRVVRGERPVVVQQRDAPASVRNWRSQQQLRQNSPTVVQQRTRNVREAARIGTRDSRPVSRVPRPGTQPPINSAFRRLVNHQQWRGDWRGDRRYDWRNHRRRYSSLFNFGFYHDPFGWGYQPFSIGWRMWPNYYRSSYWLTDPWQYRLPYAPAGTRWIRYYNDAILVDTWDGQVVDVIRDFFW